MPVAAIDCGTNSTRLLISNEDGQTLAREMRITRLGQDVDSTHRLAKAALERTYACLREFAAQLKHYGVNRARLVATSAARDASNGAEFLSEAERITGATVELLSGDEEASLSFAGATAGLRETNGTPMIVDIGGGSTELAAVVDGKFASYSMQVGCVRVTERALGAGVVTAEREHNARSMIDLEIDRALAAQPALSFLVGSVWLIGLAGTISTLAQLDVGSAIYDRDAVHHRTLSRADVARWRELLGSETPAQRLLHPGMVVGREDVLVAGLIVLEMVMDRFGATSLLTSENDILDGLVAGMLR